MIVTSTKAVRHVLLLILFASSWASADQAPDQPNVLFIAVDDLRPDLHCYGHPLVKSPHLDRLAAAGTLFNRAYCQQAVCNPSRASLMTGLRPETLNVLDLNTHFRDQRPDCVTVAQYFKQHGYFSQGIGKIFHKGHGNRDDKYSWSVQERFELAPRYGPQGAKHLSDLWQQARDRGVDLSNRKNQPRGKPWEAPDVEDHALRDGSIAEVAIGLLRQHKDEPFFLAVGFANPHLPFIAPKRYWDLYDPAEIRLADNPHPPQDSPPCAWTNWGELRNYEGMPQEGPLSDEQARTAVHGYYAAVSYVDAQVGKLLDELDRLGLRDNTVVILWGDHGWQLGEHGFWCKHTNYEVAARSPLIISAPQQSYPGAKTEGLVEFVDIYPTLVELCGLPPPKELEGISLKPLMDDPHRAWKQAVFHLFPRNLRGVGRGIGRAIRTDRYRLVAWTVEETDFLEYELYDLHTDPQENVNLAKRPEHADRVRDLAQRLRAGWKAALP